LALIAPLGKLIVEKKSAASSKRPSLPSGAIRANTSCSAVVLLGSYNVGEIYLGIQLEVLVFEIGIFIAFLYV